MNEIEKELRNLKAEIEVYKSANEALILNPNCKYIFQPNVKNMPKEQVRNFAIVFKQKLMEILHLPEGSFLVIPQHDGEGKIDMLVLENEIISYDHNA